MTQGTLYARLAVIPTLARRRKWPDTGRGVKQRRAPVPGRILVDSDRYRCRAVRGFRVLPAIQVARRGVRRGVIARQPKGNGIRLRVPRRLILRVADVRSAGTSPADGISLRGAAAGVIKRLEYPAPQAFRYFYFPIRAINVCGQDAKNLCRAAKIRRAKLERNRPALDGVIPVSLKQRYRLFTRPRWGIPYVIPESDYVRRVHNGGDSFLPRRDRGYCQGGTLGTLAIEIGEAVARIGKPDSQDLEIVPGGNILQLHSVRVLGFEDRKPSNPVFGSGIGRNDYAVWAGAVEALLYYLGLALLAVCPHEKHAVRPGAFLAALKCE